MSTLMIYVYASYYELFVSPKELSKPFMLQGVFDTVKEAETFMAENYDIDDTNLYYERSIYPQSEWGDTLSFLTDAETERYKFDVTNDGLVLQATESWKKENETLIYKNVEFGDWVRCTNCGRKMLLPCGAEKCPNCESEGTMAWVNETQEAWAEDIPNAVYTGRELSELDFLTEETISSYC